MENPFLKSPIGESPLLMEVEFKVSPERLFKAWTTASDMEQWFGASRGGPVEATIDLRVDGSWQFVFTGEDGQIDQLAGRYLNIDQNKRLVFSWIHTRVSSDGSEEKSPESKVTLTFETCKGGCHFTLLHESIQSESARVNVVGGWGAALTKLKAILEYV